MATTLAQYTFAKPVSSWVNLKLASSAGIIVGQSLTVTRPDGATITGPVRKLLPYGVEINVLSSNRVSGLLLLPKGSAVA